MGNLPGRSRHPKVGSGRIHLQGQAPQRMTEQDLIRQAGRGDESAMQALYRRYAPRVYAVVRRIAGDDALADDWAQEAWIRAFRALPRFRGDAAFSTWLHRVAVNSALQGKRSRKRHEMHESPLPAVLPGRRPVEPTELRISLERALDRLPEGMRQVLVLHDVEGFTHEEIGDMLGIAAGTSKSQLFKARGKMRDLLRPPDHVEGRAYAASDA
jgi:RNA polymerase sigma-70 factor (ECF subfamily)